MLVILTSNFFSQKPFSQNIKPYFSNFSYKFKLINVVHFKDVHKLNLVKFVCLGLKPTFATPPVASKNATCLKIFIKQSSCFVYLNPWYKLQVFFTEFCALVNFQFLHKFWWNRPLFIMFIKRASTTPLKCWYRRILFK